MEKFVTEMKSTDSKSMDGKLSTNFTDMTSTYSRPLLFPEQDLQANSQDDVVRCLIVEGAVLEGQCPLCFLSKIFKRACRVTSCWGSTSRSKPFAVPEQDLEASSQGDVTRGLVTVRSVL